MILFAVKKWEHYLRPKPFVIRTNHKSLKFLLAQKLKTLLQHTWLAKVIEFDYEIKYKKGKENKASGALSRLTSHELMVMALSSASTNLYEQIVYSWQDDPKLQQIIQQLQEDPLPTKSILACPFN